MSEIVPIELSDVLVDPSRFSPRTAPVDEAQLAQLAEALAAGESLPPLRVARSADPTPAWWGCPRHWNQAQRAGWQARERRLSWARLPLDPTAVLIDGTAVYWALRQAGRKQHTAIFDDAPVATEAEVLARAMQANLRHGRRLTDPDLRRTFVRLWLGRDLRDSGEQWRTAPGAMPLDQVLALLGRGAAWGSRMQSYAQVCYELKADPGFAKAGQIARLDAGDWRSFAYHGDQLKLHFCVDEQLRVQSRVVTVMDATVAELTLIIDRVLAVAAGQSVPDPDAAPTPDAAPAAERPAGDGQLDLPGDWSDWASSSALRFRELRPLLPRLAPGAAAEFCRRTRPLYIEVVAAYEEAQRIARQGGLEA